MKLLLPLAIALLSTPHLAEGAALMLASDAGLGARKCRTHDLPGHITVVDGQIVRDYRGDGPDAEESSRVLPESEDIMSIEVRCLRVRSPEKESGWALRSAIIVLTKSGARKVAHAQLEELVEEQRLYLDRTGRYAASLTELRFTETRASLGIEMTLNDDGWSARVSFTDPRLACRVAVGSAATADPDLRPGIPICLVN